MAIPVPRARVMERAGDTALVLAGGGARGAYEAGVLSYVYGELARRHGAPAIDVICGTSVGAINGAYLASVIDAPIEGVPALIDRWSELEIGRVLGWHLLHTTKLRHAVVGGGSGAGIFDANPLADLVQRCMGRERIAQSLRRGALRALTVSATHVPTGRPWVFVDRGPGVPAPAPPGVMVAEDRIGPEHVLASAAIPVLFPPVSIRGELFVDGGLRLNTPVAPAIHLGARRLLVVSLASARAPIEPALPRNTYPGMAFLLGKLLNAFLLDHLNADLLELERWNRSIADGREAFGSAYEARMSERALAHGRAPVHHVEALTIRPSEDIGRLAGHHLRSRRLRPLLGRSLLRLLDVGEGADADLVSYLLFDGPFAQELIALGREDARRREDELASFLLGRAVLSTGHPGCFRAGA